MKSQFVTSYGTKLEKIKTSIHKKGGIKLTDRVKVEQNKNNRQNKARYTFEMINDEQNKTVKSMTWLKNSETNQ